MSSTLTLAVSQSHTLSTLTSTLSALSRTARLAATRGADLLLFPEAYLGGYPRTCSFGGTVGSRADLGREQFLRYFKEAVDLGDTPRGGGDAWVERRLPLGRGEKRRGDGTREELEGVARDTGLFLVVGAVERAGGSLYCSAVYVCPREGCVGKRRKLMPTGTERLIWAQGQSSSLKAITTTIKDVKLTLAAAICWENYMPLLRYSLYSQNVNLYLAPTADARDTWLPLLQTIACESRAFVLSANQCVTYGNLPDWISETKLPGGVEERKQNAIKGEGTNAPDKNSTQDLKPQQTSPSPSPSRRRTSFATSENHELALPLPRVLPDGPDENEEGAAADQDGGGRSGRDVHTAEDPEQKKAFPTSPSVSRESASSSAFACRGGSCVISPTGAILAGPMWEKEDELLLVTVDFDDCLRGRLDFDAAGSYSRMDAFKLTVEGLSLDPP